MQKQEYEAIFRKWWERNYPVERVQAKDALHAGDEIIEGINERVKIMLFLERYAREVQTVGCSRSKKNKAQRIFNELGIDPTTLELD
jgi:hypothetical protein